MYLVLLTLFVFTNLQAQGGFAMDCSRGWTFSATDDVCLIESINQLSWLDARANCKESSSDLVQIKTELKETAAADIRSNESARVWIGLSDLDQDGTFEFLDGSKLVENKRFLGDDWKSLSSFPPNKKCVVINFLDKGLYYESCQNTRTHICEQQDPSRATAFGSDPCKRSSWTKVDQKFLYFHRQIGDFVAASKHCSTLGGRLLRPSSAKEESNITAMDTLWKPGAMFFWIGLKQLEGDSWVWDDGEPLADEEYKNWSPRETNTTSGLCAAVVWAASPTWNKISCESLNFHICEAMAPCGTTIFMAVDGVKQMKHNAVASRQDSKDVLIECFQEGTGSDTQISIECTPGPEKVNGSRKVNVSLSMKYRSNGSKCTCMFEYEDGTGETIKVKLETIKKDSNRLPGDKDEGGFFRLTTLLILFLVAMVCMVIFIVYKSQTEKAEAVKTDGDFNVEHEVYQRISLDSANGEMKRPESSKSVASGYETTEDEEEENEEDE